MADQTPRNEMAQRLARNVQHAHFAKSFASALAGFGGRMGANTRERLRLWRKAAPSPLPPAAFPRPDGDHPAGGISDAPPLPFWPTATR
ncbi:MAG: hypothetical protein JWR00_2878 [Rubritepida sp.]|nr:hypothetical protein [Rubritepida sp.]